MKAIQIHPNCCAYAEVERALVALPDFKSGVSGEKPGRWVRFPCTSATKNKIPSFREKEGIYLQAG
jgi:hypothetical protein